MSRPAQGTVEEVLSRLDIVSVADKSPFELWIPEQLTFRGQPMRSDFAMAAILDKILGMGYEPDGFTQGEGGRSYKYKVMA